MTSSDIQSNPTDVESGHSSGNRTLEQESANQVNNAGRGTFSTPDTGAFASYAAYLNSIVEQGPGYRGLASYFRNSDVLHLDSRVLSPQESTIFWSFIHGIHVRLALRPGSSRIGGREDTGSIDLGGSSESAKCRWTAIRR